MRMPDPRGLVYDCRSFKDVLCSIIHTERFIPICARLRFCRGIRHHMNSDSCQLKCQQREQQVYSCPWTDRLDHRRLGTKEQAQPGSCFSFMSSAWFCLPIPQNLFPSDKGKKQLLETGNFKNINPNKNCFVYTTTISHVTVVLTLAK